MKKKLLFASVLLLVFYSAVCADSLKWNDILNEALRENPDILNARRELELAEISYKNSKLNFLPSFSASAGMRKSDDRDTSYSWGINGRLDLFNGFKNINEANLRKTNLTLQDAVYKRTVADFIYRLRLAFAETLKTRMNIDLLEDILKRRKSNMELVQLRYDAGREDKGAYLRSEADYLQARFEVRREKRSYETASGELLKMTGRDIYEKIDVTGTFKIPEIEKEAPAELLPENPDYLIEQYRQEASQLELKKSYGNLYPSLGLSGTYSNSGESWPPENNSASASLSLSHSLLSGGRDLYSLKTAQLNKIIAQNSLENTARELLINMASSYNTLVNAAESYEVRKKYYAARSERSEIAREKYLNGLISYQDWDSVENEFINAQKSLLESRYSVFAAWAAWLRTTGREK